MASTQGVPKMFIGPKAKTWDQAKADAAARMEKEGRDPVDIWRQTGTFRGADGIQRQEISDVGAVHRNPDQIKELGKQKKQEAQELQQRIVGTPGQKDMFPKALTEAKKPAREEVKRLKQESEDLLYRNPEYRGHAAQFVLDHPELYKAYPELADVNVLQGGRGGGAQAAFSDLGGKGGMEIDLYESGLRSNPRSSLLHEMQHAVQSIEGANLGGSPTTAFANPEARTILEGIRKKALEPMSFEEYSKQLPRYSEEELAEGYKRYVKAIPDSVKKMDRELQKSAAMQYYTRLAGEAEARATQAREPMSASQRAQEFPYSSYDVLPEDLIVKSPVGSSVSMQMGPSDYRSVNAGDLLGDLTVGENISNKGSISASGISNVLPGVRAVPMSSFDVTAPRDLFYAQNDIDRVKALAEEIKQSGRIDPMIVGVDEEGNYILEGVHRLGALHLLGAKEFPALIAVEDGVKGFSAGGEVKMAGGGAAFGRYTTGKKYQGAVKRAREADVNTLADPRTYAFVSGLLGSAPDELGFSVMHPDYEGIKKVGEKGFMGGTILGVAPLVGPMTKGLPVGASISKNPKPFNVYHGSKDVFDEFKPGMGVTAKHIYTAPEGFQKDAAKYGNVLYKAEASPKKMIDFSDFGALDKPTIAALKKAAKDAGITDKYHSFDDFFQNVMDGQLYQAYGGQRAQNILMDELLSRFDAVKMPDATSGGGVSKSVVFKDPEKLKILERTKASGEVKMAAGGISRLLGKGAKTAKVDHPLVFPRAEPKTREEIRPIAQRVAEQMTGEFVRQNSKVTTNPVGKSRKQFERERNIPLETRNVVPEKNVPPVDYEKLKDYAIVGVPGDPSMGGVARAGSFDDPARATVELTRVGDITPDSPVPLFGGPRYGDDEKFWASNLGAATPIQSNVNALGELYDAPVLGKYIKMAPDSANFAMHNLDSLLSIQRPEQLSKGKLEQLNRLIRKGSPKYGKFPGFPGFDDPVDVLLQSQLNSDLRKHIAETLTKPTITQALGLPNGQDVVAAITHPELRNLETGVSGFSIGRMVPGATLKKGESAHPTYDTDIPGQLIGRSKYPTPYEIAFPDTTAYARSQIKPGVQEFNMMKLLGPRERIDQQYVDEMKTFEELMKQYTGKKKGGAVKSGLSSIKKV
jgi:hypothetical protein